MSNKMILTGGQNQDIFFHKETKSIYHHFSSAKQILQVFRYEQKGSNRKTGLARYFRYFYVRDSESKNSRKK